MTSRIFFHCFLFLLFIATACNAKDLSTSNPNSFSKTHPSKNEALANEKKANNVWVINEKL
jgi:hypothetical protein